MNIIDSIVKVARKHAPEILTGVGVTGVIVGTVMACKETTKIDPILEEHNKKMDDIHMCADTGITVDKETSTGVPYTAADKRKDTAICYAKTALELGKLYLPSALVMGGSIGCILGSHGIMHKRNVGLTAAYAGIHQAFEEYRKNIVEKFGADADIAAKYDVKVKKGKNGEETTYETTENTDEGDHSRFFDCESIYWDKNQNLNLMTLHAAETNLNRKLKTRRSHVVTLNEICDALDIEPFKDGQVLGYEYKPGIDPVDENGFPMNIKFTILRLNNKGRYILKSIDDVAHDDTDVETVMLLDFPGLVPIV